ncbi:unnamed protein product [Mesocestoides corti]|uniref:Dynein light chain n=1 Tax=Mesocestoides corti TaxID=53468 RepID=A0A0R3U5T2_MESCO|nr:unnamed protein product [Mesocestoides corti]
MTDSELRAIIKETAMNEDMQHAAAEVSADASTRYNTLDEISKYIKEAFEKRYGNTWHCVVGKQFGR